MQKEQVDPNFYYSKELVQYSPDPLCTSELMVWEQDHNCVLLNSHLKVNVLQSQWFGAHILPFAK